MNQPIGIEIGQVLNAMFAKPREMVVDFESNPGCIAVGLRYVGKHTCTTTVIETVKYLLEQRYHYEDIKVRSSPGFFDCAGADNRIFISGVHDGIHFV